MKNNEEMLKKFPTMKSLDADKKASKTSEAAPAAAEVKAEPEKIDFSKVKIEPLFEEAVDFDTFSKSDFRAVKVKECVAVPKSKKLLQFTLDDGTGTDRTILSGIHAYYEPEELVGKTLIAITSVSDWISIICAVVALIVTVIIAVLQIRQSNRMERFEKRQDKRDEQRHQESVKAQAVSFISKYYKDRGIIPLCAIATMYNDLFYYNREMYREFCCCTKEVQNRILEYCGLDLRVSEYSIYEKCLVAIESVLNKRFPDDKSVFYDGGKYFTRSLEYYAAKPIPHQEFEYQNHITDVLANAFNSNDKKATPIQQLSVEYNFESCEGIETCQLVTVIAEFSAIYGNKNKNIDKSYGSPGGYDGEVIETMEDLFLLALFEIYTNCVL